MYCTQGGDYSVKPGCPRRQNVETLKSLVYYQPLWNIDGAGKANPHSVENVGQLEGAGQHLSNVWLLQSCSAPNRQCLNKIKDKSYDF